MAPFRTFHLLCWLALASLTPLSQFPAHGAEPPFRVIEAKPAADLDALFGSQEGWVGADGNYSISLSPEHALWFYSDTWLGKIEGGKRRDPVMINNSVGLMTRGGDDTEPDRVKFYWGQRDGKPAAFWTPADGRGWFWLFAGTHDADRLQVFLWQMEKAAGGGAFGFKSAGVSLGEVANPHETPDRWKLEQRQVPFTEITAERRTLFGSAVLRHDGHVYIYGIAERPTEAKFGRRMLLARVPEGQMREFSAWRFWTGEGWGEDFRGAAPLVPGIASEYSVTWLPVLRKFVAVYHGEFLSPKIIARTAPSPWGPWSESVTLYTCQEPGWRKDVFCYSGKAHPWLGGDDTLVVTYAANSGRLADVIEDARLYVPRFVRVKLAPP